MVTPKVGHLGLLCYSLAAWLIGVFMETMPYDDADHESMEHLREQFYRVDITPALQQSIEQTDVLKTEIDERRPLAPQLWETVQDKLKIGWTHHSNAIEGSTLSLGETHFFLQYGLTSKGKSLKEYLDARNHAEAIDLLREIVAQERPITEGLIKEINALLLHGVDTTPAINSLGQPVEKRAYPGQYKREPNHVLQPDGSIHSYTDPLQVVPEMEYLIGWINDHLAVDHPTVVAAVAHYNLVRIHPFDDGNGRGARILMNLILMKAGYAPAIIHREDRADYIEALVQANQGHLEPFVTFICEAVIQTQASILADLRGAKPRETGDKLM